MQNLERRLSRLEMANPSTCAKEQMTFIVRLVTPTKPYREIDGLYSKEQHWARLPGESEKAFIARATSEVTRTPWGSALIVEEKQ